MTRRGDMNIPGQARSTAGQSLAQSGYAGAKDDVTMINEGATVPYFAESPRRSLQKARCHGVMIGKLSVYRNPTPAGNWFQYRKSDILTRYAWVTYREAVT